MSEVFTWLENTALSQWVREAETVWGYATFLTVHTFGMAILVGVSFVVNLRLLGVGRRLALGPMRTLFRVMWFGFWINLVTGSILFAADANVRASSRLFLVKLSFEALGVVSIVLIERRVYQAGPEPTVVRSDTRRLAMVSLLAWFAAITAGRLLAYVG